MLTVHASDFIHNLIRGVCAPTGTREGRTAAYHAAAGAIAHVAATQHIPLRIHHVEVKQGSERMLALDVGAHRLDVAGIHGHHHVSLETGGFLKDVEHVRLTSEILEKHTQGLVAYVRRNARAVYRPRYVDCHYNQRQPGMLREKLLLPGDDRLEGMLHVVD